MFSFIALLAKIMQYPINDAEMFQQLISNMRQLQFILSSQDLSRKSRIIIKVACNIILKIFKKIDHINFLLKVFQCCPQSLLNLYYGDFKVCLKNAYLKANTRCVFLTPYNKICNGNFLSITSQSPTINNS